ncbi:MBL fold metallo-hydrolase [Burkholderia sp. USMB20]|uniref:MBL fold metallo-hydrolase n=1 Tax=Burkholderia sp. USMB20 TaxID=1571773 RepID=UPI0009E50272|nr:MBL fold metallo-hydrolase [Burkholderia sp. USMB20]TGN95690.1 MBL fold metallo-hydrolase [Burkholderia sp. USMB20]
MKKLASLLRRILLAFGADISTRLKRRFVFAALDVHGQAPGFYRWRLGEFEITALSDGTLDMPVDQHLCGPKPGEVAAAFEAVFSKLPMEMSVNAFLINAGSKLIIVDAGAGTLYGPTLGHLHENLSAAGYRPEQIDMVLLTHVHGDHFGGLIIDGARKFPNAKVHVAKADLDYFLNTSNESAATGLHRINFSAARTVFSAYRATGQIKPFVGSHEIMPGIRAVPAPGHSPGHTAYLIESKNQKLMLWGDLLHVPQLQLAHPEYSMDSDFDQCEGRTSRTAFFHEAAALGYWIAAAHLPFPGIGHVKFNGSSYTYIPADYTANR